jgi:hypothetical protein
MDLGCQSIRVVRRTNSQLVQGEDRLPTIPDIAHPVHTGLSMTPNDNMPAIDSLGPST